jgi:hypothetical protein
VLLTQNLTTSTYYTPTGSPTTVGTYTATYNYATTTNYLASSGNAQFQITQAPSTVTVTCPTTAQTYTGSALTPCTARYFGANISGSGVLFTPVTYTNNIDPGTATANATWSGDTNHTGSSNSATFQIKAPATVSAVANSKTYGAVDPVLTVTSSGFAPEDLPNITFSATRAAGENAGNYTITPSASGAPLANYIVTYNTATFTINNPVPTTTGLSPSSATAGGSAFTLTVNGTNFVNGSTVRWNGSDRTTAYVSSTQLTASITAADIPTAGTASVSVFTGAPGGGTSNAQTFTININNPVPTTTGLSPSSATAGGSAFTLTVNGTNFVNGSTVRWNGSDRTTSYVSSTQLTASIPAADIATGGTASVTVFNGTPGGGTSNAHTFTMTAITYRIYLPLVIR